MKKIVLAIIFIGSICFTPRAKAQNAEFQKQIQEIMKAREEMLNSLMDGNGDMEKKMMEMMERFSKQSGMPDFDIEGFEGPVVGEYDWIISENQKILKIKVKQIKDRPLDIKIEKGMIKIKGDVETIQGSGKNKVTKKINFERSFSLPNDIDQTSPEFENTEGEVLIKFKRLGVSRSKKGGATAPAKKVNERLPVTPNSDDLTI